MNDEIKQVGYHLAAYFLIDTKFIIAANIRGVVPEWFEDLITQDIVRLIFDHYKDYNSLIDTKIFESALDYNGASQHDKKLYISTFTKINTIIENDHNFDYWLNLFAAYHVKKESVKVLEASIAKLSENDIEGAANLISNANIPFISSTILKKSYSIQETAEARWEEYLDRKEHPEKYQGLLTNIYEFDVRMNGFRQGEDLAVVVARSGIGKSICLAVIAKNFFINGYDGIFAGAEMTQEANIMRLDASFADLNFDYIRDGKLSESEEELYKAMLYSQCKNENVLVMVPQERSRTPSMLEMEIKNFINVYGRNPQYLIVDYINIMSIDNIRGLQTNQIQQKVIEEIKILGEKYKLLPFTASQQTRTSVNLKAKNKNYKPGTEAIALSDSIGSTATFVLILEETEEDENEGTLTASCVKARFGDKKIFKLRKNWKRMCIADCEDGLN